MCHHFPLGGKPVLDDLPKQWSWDPYKQISSDWATRRWIQLPHCFCWPTPEFFSRYLELYIIRRNQRCCCHSHSQLGSQSDLADLSPVLSPMGKKEKNCLGPWWLWNFYYRVGVPTSTTSSMWETINLYIIKSLTWATTVCSWPYSWYIFVILKMLFSSTVFWVNQQVKGKTMAWHLSC